MNSTDNNPCIHKWIKSAEFQICEKCGEMILSENLRSLPGIIYNDNPLKRIAEDAAVQSAYRKKNDKCDEQ